MKVVITFDQIKRLFAFDAKKTCVEILFCVNGYEKFNNCWMGKYFDKKTKSWVYWFGLTEDGKNAFDYPTFEEFSSAKVFIGKSFCEIWDAVTVLEIDGCDPMERIMFYIGETK